MVYIAARYKYQWIGFLADFFYLAGELAAPLHSIINILALSSQDLDLVPILR